MSLNNPRPGIGDAAQYIVAGLPWAVSGSVGTTPVPHELPYVTRAVTVANNSAAANFLLVGFTQNGLLVGSSSFALDGGKVQRFEVRVRDLWFKAQTGTVNYSVLAELTPIERAQMPYLTSSASPSQLVASSSWVYPGVG